jgi:hypothetical protein
MLLAARLETNVTRNLAIDNSAKRRWIFTSGSREQIAANKNEVVKQVNGRVSCCRGKQIEGGRRGSE